MPILPTNFYSNTTGPTGPVALSFIIQGPYAQMYQAELNVQGPTGGMHVGITVPSGASVLQQAYGHSTGINAVAAQWNGATFVPAIFSIGGATGPISLSGIVNAPTGVTGTGQVVMGCMAATGPTGVIATGSYLMIFQST